MSSVGIGEYAAIGTSFTWAISSHVHGAVSKRVGPGALTLMRTPFQIFFLLLFCLLWGGAVPALTPGNLLLICLSGFCGLALGDLLLYHSIIIIGPQMGVLLNSVSAIFTTGLGWLLLGERLPLPALGGILLITLGVGVVMLERSGSTLLPGQSIPTSKQLALGIALGIASAFFMACSFILIKKVLRSGLDPLWVTLFRCLFANLLLWGVGFLKGWTKDAMRGMRSEHKFFWMLLGSNLAGASGLWLSNVALNQAPSGIAAALIGLQPVMVTIIGALWYRKRPALQVLLGTAVAFSGSALLCLR